MNKKPLIILTGPTAVGKTALSIELAKQINGEIISADSMQVYKYMDIGTAKVTKAEMQGIKHYLIDELLPSDDINVYIFQKRAKMALEEIYASGHIPIIAGGTGFYIQSVLYDIDFVESDTDTEYRKELYELLELKGAEYIHDMLKAVDPKAANEIHPNNSKRVIRALEYYKQNNSPISKHNEEQAQKESPYNFVYFVLNDNRERIYERIDTRVDKMIADGLLDEVKTLMDMGYTRDMVSMKGIGYKEIIDYYNGEYSLDEAVYIIKRETRHFAKRQLTWFGREKDVTFINRHELKVSPLEYALNIIKDKGIV